VALDERYHVYVADSCNDRVLQFDPFGRLVRSYGAPAPARGDAGRDRVGVLDRPHAVAVRGDVVAIAGGDQPRRCGVQRFTRQGALLRPLRCHGDAAMAWSAPRGLAADAAKWRPSVATAPSCAPSLSRRGRRRPSCAASTVRCGASPAACCAT
jgi:hypothetical protein